jgi:hypothetical protein
MDTSGPRHDPVASSCEYAKEFLGHIKGGEILDQIIDYQLCQNAVIHVISQLFGVVGQSLSLYCNHNLKKKWFYTAAVPLYR